MLNSTNGGLRGFLAVLLGMAATPAFTGIDLPRTSVKRGKPGFAPYVDRAGVSHGRSGDKLARRAAHGLIGLRNRGPYAAWHLKAK